METGGKPYRRLALIGAMLAGFILILIGQLFRLQVLSHSSIVLPAQAESASAWRGTIMDCNGYPLALDVVEYEVSAAPREIKDAQKAADRLCPLLNVRCDRLLELLSGNELYVPVQRRVSKEVSEAIASLHLKGIYVKPRPKRVYPQGMLAAHVLGFVNADGEGNYGLEGHYDSLLKGEEADQENRESTPASLFNPIPQRKGPDLVLTLDRNIQYVVERELAEGVARYKADGGTVIVMEPKTGAILAMASYPSYDPNNFAETPLELFVNPAVSKQYEPGSVFKIVTMAAGLDTGTITPQTSFHCAGVTEIGGLAIHSGDDRAHGQETMTEVLVHSCNVGAVHVSTALGKEKFYEYVLRFGFGRKTGVDLDGEIPGQLKLPDHKNWHYYELGTNAFGQGIAVTPLQMTTAVAAVANGGLLMKPHLVEKILDGHSVTEIHPTIVRRVISASAAKELTGMLVEAAEQGAPKAAVPGYHIAGKTGTAEIPTPKGYDPWGTIASFAGYAPADDPRFVILVKLDRPRTDIRGSEVAAPIFKRIAEQLFVYLDIPPDAVRLAYTNPKN